MKKISKILSIILSIMMIISIVPITASAATPTSGTCGENVTWEFDNSTGTLTIFGTGDMYDYEIYESPWESFKDKVKEVNIDYGITRIGNNVFYEYTNLQSITIPNSVAVIGECSFYKCSNLTSAVIPNSVTIIGISAFDGCSSLTNVVIPDSVKTIGASAFYDCTTLASITIPDSVTSIGIDAFYNTAYFNDGSNWENNVLYMGNHLYQAKYTMVGTYIIRNGTKTIADSAFSRCKNLSNITIPNSVVTIGESAFYNCDSLINILISHNVVTIGERAFSLCDNLQSIIIDVNNQYYSSDEYGVLFNKDKSTLIQYPGGNKQTNYLIPDTVSEIVAWAFGHAYDLASITIPDSVTTIGEHAFYYCSTLTDVKIGNGVTEISDWMFGECVSLETFTIPDNITRIGDYAFYWCDNINNVIIGKNVTSIGWMAFDECTNIKDVYYADTKNKWEAIAIDDYNDSLTNATIHYNSAGPHIHKYETVVTPATCTERGYTTYTCVCGDSFVDDYVDATGHNYTSEITTPSTHTTTGVETFTCDCGDSYTEVIAKLEKHNYKSVATAPNCTEQGYTTYTCECGDSYVDDYVDALGHTEEIIPAVAPTCTESGLTEGVKCSVCSETLAEQETVDALGHTSTNPVEEILVAPTCTENGSKDVVIYCSVCEEEISRETVTLEATGHDAGVDGNCNICDEHLCDHNCHKGGITGFFWKITLFFNKLFGSNKYCSCGVAHY